MRTGWEIESWIPAKTPARDFCAAKPSTATPTPAEASSDRPMFRTTSNCISRMAPEVSNSSADVMLRATVSRVRSARLFSSPTVSSARAPS
jgi:hypothetical protein